MIWYVIQVRYPSGLIVAFRVQVMQQSQASKDWEQYDEFEEVAKGLGGSLYTYDKED